MTASRIQRYKTKTIFLKIQIKIIIQIQIRIQIRNSVLYRIGYGIKRKESEAISDASILIHRKHTRIRSSRIACVYGDTQASLALLSKSLLKGCFLNTRDVRVISREYPIYSYIVPMY